MIRISILLWLMFSFVRVYAQPLLKPEDALALALKQNFDIELARTDSAVATNNQFAGNAGQLPQLNLSGSAVKQSNNLHQTFSSGLEVNKSGVGSSNINLSLGLSYTLFDGFKMFAAADRLRFSKEQSLASLRQSIDQISMQVLNAYFDIVRQEQLLKVTQQSIEAANVRLNIARQKLQLGSSDQVEVSQAGIDLNTFKAQEIRQTLALEQAKVRLNQLLARPADESFAVIDTIIVQTPPNEFKPASVEVLQRQTMVANAMVRELKAGRWPTISFNPSYSFARSESDAGFSLLNQTDGLNVGLGINWRLYDGNRLNRQIKAQQLQVQRIETGKQQLISLERAQWQQSKLAFEAASKLMLLEQGNRTEAGKVLSIILERYRLGSTNAIVVKDALKSYEEIAGRSVTAAYEAKMAELQLRRLAAK
jgi:outer membrane protein TolC